MAIVRQLRRCYILMIYLTFRIQKEKMATTSEFYHLLSHPQGVCKARLCKSNQFKTHCAVFAGPRRFLPSALLCTHQWLSCR